jgi:hypothetical protein
MKRERNWTNARTERLLAWAFRYSPSLGRAPSFREAWTGRTVVLAEHCAAYGFTQGLHGNIELRCEYHAREGDHPVVRR